MADKLIETRVREAAEAGRGAVLTQLRETESDSGIYMPVVSVGGVDGDITLTGDLIVDTFGALDDAKETDPDAASATLPSLSRGQLEKLNVLASTVSNIAKQWSMQVALCYGGTVMNPAHEDTLQTLVTAVGSASDNAGDPTVIGLLKQIAANTDPG